MGGVDESGHGLLRSRDFGAEGARAAGAEPRGAHAGPTTDPEEFLQVRSVKAFYDASLGSRGAKMIGGYSDQPDELGEAGAAYGFIEELVTRSIGAGFQGAIHAIGDGGNRDVLDFYERAFAEHPEARALRHRIEHAQVVHPDDFARFAELNLVAAMQPPHGVEDSPWAEDRVGPERVLGAYAWRTMRRHGVPLIFSADLNGSDFDIFYGLHCAITRQTRDLEPPGSLRVDARKLLESAELTASGSRLHVSFPADMVLRNAAHLFRQGYYSLGLHDLVDLNGYP